MERIIDRARAAMNLILVTSLLVFWASAQKSIDVLDMGVEIYKAADGMPKEIKPESVALFLSKVDSKKGDLTSRVAFTSLATVLDIDEQQVKSLPDIQRTRFNNWYNAQTADPKKKELFNTELKEAFDIKKFGMDVQMMKLENEVNIVLNRIQRLENIVKNEQINPLLTFGDIQQRFSRKLKIPFIDQDVTTDRAVFLLAIALMGPLAYLLSICSTLLIVMKNSDRVAGLDWIMLHPGKLSLVLGGLWVFGPAFAVAFGMVTEAVYWPISLTLSFLLTAMGILVLQKTFQLRHLLHNRLDLIK